MTKARDAGTAGRPQWQRSDISAPVVLSFFCFGFGFGFGSRKRPCCPGFVSTLLRTGSAHLAVGTERRPPPALCTHRTMSSRPRFPRNREDAEASRTACLLLLPRTISNSEPKDSGCAIRALGRHRPAGRLGPRPSASLFRIHR